MGNPLKPFATPRLGVRTRRAYFDCQFGQLHVRTAFPTTGGFDEQVTLFCLHPIDATGRIFSRLMPEIADVRSVYAPDLPGHGESDLSPTGSVIEAAAAISDLANDLRLRQIDLLGLDRGAAVALQLAATRPELVRRLVLGSDAPSPRQASPAQRLLMLRPADYSHQRLDAEPEGLASHISKFLSSQS